MRICGLLTAVLLAAVGVATSAAAGSEPENALADLTQPAPPTAVRAAEVGAGVRIAIRRTADPRIQTIVVYRGEAPLRGTENRVRVDHRPPRGRRFLYTVVLRDRWSTSARLGSNTVAAN